MMRLKTPADVLPEIPGFESATWRETSGGLTNRGWLLDNGETKAVLKIDAEPRQPPLNDRAGEARVQQRAAARGLAGRVLYVRDGIYLTEFVDGRVWQADQLRETDNLIQLARALKELHALPLTGRVFDPVQAALRYMEQIGDRDPELTARYHALVRATPAPQHLCCCHNDLVAENIVDAGRLLFLDWEYACDNDPFFDLATIVAHHRLSTRQAETLLDAYFDGDGSRWRRQLADQERLYEALAWLWQAARRG